MRAGAMRELAAAAELDQVVKGRRRPPPRPRVLPTRRRHPSAAVARPLGGLVAMARIIGVEFDVAEEERGPERTSQDTT
jgi:hypothetical protein